MTNLDNTLEDIQIQKDINNAADAYFESQEKFAHIESGALNLAFLTQSIYQLVQLGWTGKEILDNVRFHINQAEKKSQ